MATLLRPPLVFDRRQKRPIGTPDSYPNLIASTLRSAVLTLVAPLTAEQLDDSAPPRPRQVRVDLTPNLLTSTLFATTERIRQGLEQWDDSAPPRKGQVRVDLPPNLLGTTLAGAAPVSLDLPLRVEMWDDGAQPRKRQTLAEQFMGRAVWLDPVPQVQRLDTPAFQAKYQVIAQQLDARAVWRDPVPAIARLDSSAWQGKEPVYVDPPRLLTLQMSLVTVPNVVGGTQAQADIDLAAVGLTSSVSNAYSDTVAAGLVISQAPPAGGIVALGSVIAIVVSLGVQPAPVVPNVVPAGKAGRKERHRYFVQIDGQDFEVASSAQAIEILQRARAIAEQQAEQKAERATKQLKRKRVVPAVRIAAPAITVSPEIRAEAAPLIADITRLYEKAAVNAELRLLLMKQMRDDDDDEDDVLLLL